MAKPVVHYRAGSIQRRPKKGQPVYLQTLDHTSPLVTNWPQGNGHVCTSAVVKVMNNGEFETRNTIYKPLEI